MDSTNFVDNSPSSQTKNRTIALIGPGKLGTSMSFLATSNQWNISHVVSRSPEKYDTFLEALSLHSGIKKQKVLPSTLDDAIEQAEIIFICVADDALKGLAKQVSKIVPTTDPTDSLKSTTDNCPQKIFFHFSGSYSSEVLLPIKEKGHSIASCHPLFTFTGDLESVKIIQQEPYQYHCTIEGDELGVIYLQQFMEDIGFQSHKIATENKIYNHIAAVMACNYLNSLMDMAINLSTKAGLPPTVAKDSLLSLAKTTIENIATLGTQKALTGPISRADIHTIQKHLEAIKALDEQHQHIPTIFQSYLTLGEKTVEIAARGGHLDTNKIQSLLEILHLPTKT